MQKIISLFQRNYDGDRLVRDEVVPGAEWVIAGEGTATRKYDGTCCRVRDGRLYKRYDAKVQPTQAPEPGQTIPFLRDGKAKTPPVGFEPAQDPDPVTGHWPGWVPVGDGNEDRWHRDGWANAVSIYGTVPGGTYELVGPRLQGNPEGFADHGATWPGCFA